MQLTYRGQTYTRANATLKMIDTGLTANFRGAAYSVQRADFFKIRPMSNLTYRGVAYT
jgi:hypothetical protein